MNSRSSLRKVETMISLQFVKDAVEEKLRQFRAHLSPSDKIVDMHFGGQTIESILASNQDTGILLPLTLEIKREQEVRVTKSNAT